MKIKDLKKGMSDVNITLEIDFIGEKRRTTGYGDSAFVQVFLKDDESGEIQMTFWNEQIAKVKKAKKVKITNGYVSSFRGQLQLKCSEENPPEFLN